MARFVDLYPEEVSDLFLCAHRVEPVIQREYQGTSLTIAVQVVGGREGGKGGTEVGPSRIHGFIYSNLTMDSKNVGN